MEKINIEFELGDITKLKRMLKKEYPDFKYCKAGNHVVQKTGFAKNGGGTIRCICKECYNKSFKQYYQNNRERWITVHNPKNYAMKKLKKEREQKMISETIVNEKNIVN